MKRLIVLLIALAALVSSPAARAEGYVQGTKDDVSFLAEWDTFLHGLPVPGNPQCPPNRPQYQGCWGPWGPNGSWYGWSYTYYGIQLVSGDVWQTYLDPWFPDRIQLLAESSSWLNWEMFDWLALNRVCTPGPYKFVCPMTRVNFYTYTQEEVVDILTAAWESTLE